MNEKQTLFKASTPFKISLEAVPAASYRYDGSYGIIINNQGLIIGYVLEFMAYSIRCRFDILGIPTIVFIRYEHMIFDENSVKIGATG